MLRIVLYTLLLSGSLTGFTQPPNTVLDKYLPEIPDPSQEFSKHMPKIGFPNTTPSTYPNGIYDPNAAMRTRTRQQNQALIGLPYNGQTQQQRNRAMLDEAMSDMEETSREYEIKKDRQNYRQAWNSIVGMMNSESYNLKDAIYNVESAILPGYMSYAEYGRFINNATATIYQALEYEGYDCNDESAKKLMLHRFMKGIIEVREKNYGQLKRTRSMQYDFDDPMGQKNIASGFVLKLIKTGKGQCHSLPLFYLIMAEELEFDAWLSTSPNHFFVKLKDKHGKLYNLELTNGHYTNDQFMMQSGFIRTESIRDGIYLDTLSAKRVLHRCLTDLASYHIKEYGYQPYLQQDLQNLVASDATNITALLTLSNYASFHFQHQVKAHGYPKKEDLSKYEGLNELFEWRNRIYNKIDAMGYTPMAVEEYVKWLASFNEVNKEKILRP